MIDHFLGSIGYANFLIVLTILIFVHELGHFLAARWAGVKVEVFSIGFGKEIVGFNDKHGTRWRISLLPLGGYVKMLGEMASVSKEEVAQTEAEIAKEDLPKAFHRQSLWHRAVIIFAGPLANFIYGVIVLSIIAMVYGVPQERKFVPAVIGAIQPNSAAASGGLQALDQITAIDGNPIANFEEMRQAIVNSDGRQLAFTITRQGSEIQLFIRPDVIASDKDGKPIYRLGAQAQPLKYNPVGVLEAIKIGFVGTYSIIKDTLIGLAQIFGGATADLGGPVMIAKLSNDFAQLGLLSFLSFTVMLSVNLGILNLFPLPVLDGGHLVLLAIEKIIGRPLPDKVQSWIFKIGFAFLASVFVLITIKDIINF